MNSLEVQRSMDEVERADIIAYVAHIGQTRGDGRTPYIAHPRRVRALVEEWVASGLVALEADDLRVAMAAALLHDVLEDTSVQVGDLVALGIGERTINTTRLLTKQREGHRNAPYYEAISRDFLAALVKGGDRFSNLEDAERDVLAGVCTPERWLHYVEGTRKLQVIFRNFDGLHGVSEEVERRTVSLERAIGQARSLTCG